MQPEDSSEAAKEETKPLVEDKNECSNQEPFSDGKIFFVF